MPVGQHSSSLPPHPPSFGSKFEHLLVKPTPPRSGSNFEQLLDDNPPRGEVGQIGVAVFGGLVPTAEVAKPPRGAWNFPGI